MGTLTKKLHILKSGGTEETCNIYTTPGEVGGSPYLALEVDGTKGYVKLGSTTDANATHLRVERNGTTYAAQKEMVMPGYLEVRPVSGGIKFTVPAGVNVVYMHNSYASRYIGVTPGSTHTLMFALRRDDLSYIYTIYCNDHNYKSLFNWTQDTASPPWAYIDWASSINDHAVDVKHYDSTAAEVTVPNGTL